MKKYSLIFLLIFFGLSVHAQTIKGSWNGTLQIPGGPMNVIFNMDQEGGIYQASMDIPAQKVKGLKASSVLLEDKKVTIKLDMIQSVYVGEVASDTTINGEWQQNGFKFPLNLTTGATVKTVLSRPQTPKPPMPYQQKEVIFENKKAGIFLTGTLTVPEGDGQFPAVVLVSGSGPQDRDSELFGHKPFVVIADHLSRNGIAVLRYDDRGVGTSTGDFAKATTFDFAEDAEAALAYLRKEEKIYSDKVGLIGHSEGGLVGPIVAYGGNRPAFLVLLAAPAMEIDELMLEQARLLGEASGTSPEIIRLQVETNARVFALMKAHPQDENSLKKIAAIFAGQLTTLAKGTLSEESIRKQAEQIARQTASPWFTTFINIKPKKYLESITGPVLALNGSKDLQIPAKQNLQGIREILGTNKKVTLTAQELPGLNHLFQTANTGSVSEYGEIEETFSPAALKIISDWILLR